MGEEAQATISFRAMTEADIPALVGIEAQSFYDAWNENMLRNEIANELTTYLVMECAGKLVGYAGFWLVAGEAQITRVAVADEERGQGYGTRLTAALVNKAWRYGYDAGGARRQYCRTEGLSDLWLCQRRHSSELLRRQS